MDKKALPFYQRQRLFFVRAFPRAISGTRINMVFRLFFRFDWIFQAENSPCAFRARVMLNVL
jgi:hypothetical protein